MLLRKLESSIPLGTHKPTLHDYVTFEYAVFDYQPVSGSRECKGRQCYVEAQPSLLKPSYAYESLPSLRDAVQRMHDWRGMETAFKDAKTVFAEYNKWDEYGMILFKDVELAHDERLVENNGTTTPWLGDQQGPLEKALSPRMLRLWEGQLLPYMFRLQRREAAPMHDITFERKAASRLGGLGLVRLDPLERRASGGRPEVEVVQGRAIVTCPPDVSSEFLPGHRLVPIMWEFRRVLEGPSDRYRPIATRFRVHQTLGGQESQSDRSEYSTNVE
ncbi:hypothetical protein LTS09_018010 [Friedmanniomyces endolithicus]|nr:hypothetical protein LTS09_018010 [Friedmanniomyces endolithicus]